MRLHHLIHWIIGLSLPMGIFTSPACAQETDTTYSQPESTALSSDLHAGEKFVIKLRDGSQIIGELKRETLNELTLTTSIGEVKIARRKIVELTRMAPENIRNGHYWYPDPHQTRAFAFPTASTLPRGKVFYENYYLFFNSLNYGLTDRTMVSFGVVPLPNAAIFTAGPKVRVYQNPAKTVEAAVGAHFFYGTDGEESTTLFIPYGVIGFGSPGRGRLNIGGGGLTIENENAFFLNLSGDVRISKRLKFMGELFILSADSETHTLPIYGLRFFSEKLAFDLGFWNLPGEEDATFLGTPLASFVFQF